MEIKVESRMLMTRFPQSSVIYLCRIVSLWVLIVNLAATTFANPLPAKQLDDKTSADSILTFSTKANQALYNRLVHVLPESLRKATEVQLFYDRRQSGQWNRILLATLSEQSNPHMFHLMKKTIFEKGPGFSLISNTEVIFIVSGKPIYSASYYPNVGWLVIVDSQHGRVSEELREWIASLLVKLNVPSAGLAEKPFGPQLPSVVISP